MMAALPPGLRKPARLARNSSRSSSSSLTAIRRAWKVRVAGSIAPHLPGTPLRTTSASLFVVTIGSTRRASTIRRAIRRL